MGSNVNLPDSIVVNHAQAVPADFHARFSATARRYRYLVYNRATRSAIAPGLVTWVRQPLAVQLMHGEAQSLLGERDFSSFRAASCQSSTPMRCVDFVEVFERGDFVVIDIQANAFLHHMVRNIAGALLAVGKGSLATGAVAQLLNLADRRRAPDTAPANGLYLVGVSYPDRFGLPVAEPGPVFLFRGPEPALRRQVLSVPVP